MLRLCSAQANLRLCRSHATKSGYIHLQMCGKESTFWYVTILFSFPIFMEEKSIHSEIVKLEQRLYTNIERPWLEERHTEKMESRDVNGK